MTLLSNGYGVVSLGDLFGPIHCNHIFKKGKNKGKPCKMIGWSIVLSPEETKKVEHLSGTELITYIFKKGLGKTCCDMHLPNKFHIVM